MEAPSIVFDHVLLCNRCGCSAEWERTRLSLARPPQKAAGIVLVARTAT